jgi:hypothetical protein
MVAARGIVHTIAFAFCLLSISGSSSWSNDPPPPRVYYRVAELTPDNDATPSLVGGVIPADPTQWSSIFYSLVGADFCTATLIGDKVLLTAAHCVQSTPTLSVGAGKNANTGTCEAAPDFDQDMTADWALCQMKESFAGVVPERVNQTLAAIENGTDLLLTGFGCMVASGPGNSGTFSIGTATVVSTPNGSNYIATVGAVAACYGDSGGPAFVGSDTNTPQTRSLVSINSKGNARNTTLLASIGTHAAICFFQKWSSNKGLKINGQVPALKDCDP